jgi:hypothetical protein
MARRIPTEFAERKLPRRLQEIIQLRHIDVRLQRGPTLLFCLAMGMVYH